MSEMLRGSFGHLASVPDVQLPFTGKLWRSGHELVLFGIDGRHHRISSYFASESRPALIAPNEVRLLSDLVDLSSGSVTAELYARAHPIAAVGSVGQVVGDVIVVRNGVAVTLHVGDAVYKNDAVLTGSGSSISIVFPDGTALNLVANTMMVMNEYSYDPRVTSNVALITLVGGSFSFVAGRVAHAGELKIETPVATMDIHGGAGSVHEQVATTSTNLGQGGYSFSHGQYDLIDQTGSVIATAPESGLVTFVTLGKSDLPPTVSTAPMTNSEVFQILNLLNTSPLSGAGGDLDIQLIPQVIHDNSAAPVTLMVRAPSSPG